MKKMSHYVCWVPLVCFVLGIIFILPPKGRSQDLDPIQIIQTAPDPLQTSPAIKQGEKPLPIFIPEQEKETKKTSLQISPNPVSQTAKVKIINPGDKAYTLYVYNYIGEVVRQIDNIIMNEITIQWGNLKSGIYFLQLYNQNIRITISRMIIN